MVNLHATVDVTSQIAFRNAGFSYIVISVFVIKNCIQSLGLTLVQTRLIKFRLKLTEAVTKTKSGVLGIDLGA